MKATWERYRLRFRELAITSRDSMTEKDTWLLHLTDSSLPGGEAVGEVAMFRGLSAEDTPDFEAILDATCRKLSRCPDIASAYDALPPVSSIRFGFESALLRVGCSPWQSAMNGERAANEQEWLKGDTGIRINGLVWMGDKSTMLRRIRLKLDQGFHCVKLKIGGIDFQDELELIAGIRREFTPDEIELRLDANGGFSPSNALDRLNRLAPYGIHSIEQPIKPDQLEEMHRLCELSPVDIALDEELIGVSSDERKITVLDTIRPRYIILKPSLCGGFAEAEQWIALASDRGIGWWATSALESNIGLEALGRWTASLSPSMPQGLGTGALFTNNFPSPLEMRGERLWYNPSISI